MDKHYIYIIRRREHVRTGEHIYKIGHTTRGIERLKEYDNGVGIEIHCMLPVNNSKEVERKIVELFDSKYESAYECTGSLESYKGNVEDMVRDVKKLSSEHITLPILDRNTINRVEYQYITPNIDHIIDNSYNNIDNYIVDQNDIYNIRQDFLLACEYNDSISAINLYNKFKTLYANIQLCCNITVRMIYNKCCTMNYIDITYILDSIVTLSIKDYLALFHTSCKYNNLDISKYIYLKHLSQTQTYNISVVLCKEGNLNLFSWLYSMDKINPKHLEEYYRIAIYNNRENIANWIAQLYYP